MMSQKKRKRDVKPASGQDRGSLTIDLLERMELDKPMIGGGTTLRDGCNDDVDGDEGLNTKGGSSSGSSITT